MPRLYGGAHSMFAYFLAVSGVGIRLVASEKTADGETMVDGDSRANYSETGGNLLGNITDLAAFAEVAHRRGIVFDSILPTPTLLGTNQHGADIVTRSLLQFTEGHGTNRRGSAADSRT